VGHEGHGNGGEVSLKKLCQLHYRDCDDVLLFKMVHDPGGVRVIALEGGFAVLLSQNPR